MSRFAVTRTIAGLAVLLLLAACSRGQPMAGLSPAQTSSEGDSGPIVPGSAREFSARIGDTVYFTTDQVELSPEAQQILAAQAAWLNQYTQYRVILEGHADERGTREYNIGLGAQRAANAKHFLAARGISPDRIKTVSYGKERPVAVCANISCWSQNRRVVTVVSQGGGAGY
ncbi:MULTISPECIES: peptidoglycan-associated lipoprotein Pal [Rhodomicrobium]|uniref:peptidoglycan-associated lipoprotein Pal n=1 Tax=Rhodomicrobium TaxID=1068 RepID=UPI000B4BC6C7|nr:MULTISPECIES: peptidoglycan-associated lipoprotein Pal [Rhodomicrobium]